MMYSRFIFGNFKGKSTKDRQLHPYRAFEGPLGSAPNNEFAWMIKLRMQQTKLVAKMSDASLNMVALLPQSSRPTLPCPSFIQDNNNNKSYTLWDNLPSSFDLNFAVINPDPPQATGCIFLSLLFNLFSRKQSARLPQNPH